MNLREAAQQALEALQIWQDSLTNPSAMPGWRFAVVGEKAIAALRAALAEDRSADSGKTYDDTDDTPEQRMLRKKWFGGRLYGHLPFLEAVDETMKRLYDKLDEANGTWKMLDNHFPDAGKMVATIRPKVKDCHDDSSEVGPMRLAERVPARGTLLERNVMEFFDRVYAEKTSQESRQVEPVATIRPEVTVEPVATISKTETVEPVAWATVGFVTWGNRQIEKVDKLTREAQPEYGFVIPLYTAPPKHKPLTAPQIHELDWPDDVAFENILEFTRAIERAHGIWD